jgi:hypothetical protein
MSCVEEHWEVHAKAAEGNRFRFAANRFLRGLGRIAESNLTARSRSTVRVVGTCVKWNVRKCPAAGSREGRKPVHE